MVFFVTRYICILLHSCVLYPASLSPYEGRILRDMCVCVLYSQNPLIRQGLSHDNVSSDK